METLVFLAALVIGVVVAIRLTKRATLRRQSQDLGRAILRSQHIDEGSAVDFPLGPSDPRERGVEITTASGGREWLEAVLMDRDDGWFYAVSRPRDGAPYVTIYQEHPGDWKNLSTEVLCVGTKHRMDNVKRFLKERMLWIELERDPGNPHDPNAIKVLGVVKASNGHDKLHVGFVPKADAASIAADVPPSVPLVGKINFVDPRMDDTGNIKITFAIQAPSRTCPSCGGDLGGRPRQPGACNACGAHFTLSPKFKVVTAGGTGH